MDKHLCEDCTFFEFDERFYTERCMRTIILITNPYHKACEYFRMSDRAKRYYEKKDMLENRNKKDRINIYNERDKNKIR